MKSMKSDGIKIGVCGAGSFARHFIPLFKAHPLVSEVVLCDLDAEKLAARATQFSIARTCPSLDELCGTDVRMDVPDLGDAPGGAA